VSISDIFTRPTQIKPVFALRLDEVSTLNGCCPGRDEKIMSTFTGLKICCSLLIINISDIVN